MVGDAGFPLEWDGDDIHGLVVVEGAKHEIVQGFDLVMISAGVRSG
jgi:hypothetical protein